MTKFSLNIEELIKRHIIRNDQSYEYLNKMTDDEIRTFEKEVEDVLIENNVPKIYPDFNASVMAKMIDTDIFYKILKLNKYEQ